MFLEQSENVIAQEEFAVVVFDPEEDRNALSEKLDKEIRRYNRNSRYRMSISRGFSSIRDDRGKLKTTGEWKYEADTNMYQNKMKERKTHELFQVAAVIITALLLYHFLTQKKLHNANVKTFTYILVLSGLYILSDLLGTLTIMNYTAEDEGTVMGILTGIYLLDILIPYILYS
jgi:hypothetical protein